MKFDKKIMIGFLKFGFFASLGAFGFIILGYADTMILTYFTDLKNVALYNVAVPIVSLLWYFSRSATMVIYPMSSELWAKKHKDFSKGVEMLQKYSFVIIIPFALVMFSFPDIIIRLLFGESYVPAQYALQILAVGAIAYTVMNINNNVLMAIGQVKQNTYYLLIGAFFNLVLNFILIPLYGIIGAAIATSLSYVVVLILTSLRINKSVKTRLPWFGLVKSLISGLIFVSVIMWLKKILELNVWVETGICISISLIIYITLIFLLRIVSIGEIKKIIKLTFSK
jgi:O-antigen/teichoic acid export membrane protein